MKTLVRKDTSKFITKKRILLSNSLIFTVIMIFLTASCTKIDPQVSVRLVFPIVTTAPASDTTATTVVSGGNITSDGGYAITARGVCWGSSANPSTLYPDSITVDGTGTGQFASTASGLASNKTYHIRAYATNSQGTSYGLDISFTTLAK